VRARERSKTRGAFDSAMDAALVERLAAAVARLEAAVASGASASSVVPRDLDVPAASDPAIVAYHELVAESVGRVTAAANKIGGKVLDATKVLLKTLAINYLPL
jgi:adenylyl cyclase-associated protein